MAQMNKDIWQGKRDWRKKSPRRKGGRERWIGEKEGFKRKVGD